MKHFFDKNKILILIETDPKYDIFFNDWISNGYNADVIFKKMPPFLRLIRRFFLTKNLLKTSLKTFYLIIFEILTTFAVKLIISDSVIIHEMVARCKRNAATSPGQRPG